MAQDPFDDLERQLRSAVAARRVARRSMRRRHRSGLGLVLLTLIGGGTAATAGVFHSDRPSDVDRAISAGLRVAQKDPACTVRFPRRTGEKIATMAGAADPRIAARFAIFRRPTRAVDRRVNLQFAAFGGTVLRDTVRAVVAADGARFTLAISQGRIRAGHVDQVACASAAREAAVAHVPATNAPLRQHVARIMDGRVAAARRNSAPSAQQLSLGFQSRFSKNSGGGMTLIRDGRIPSVGGYRSDRDDTTRVRIFFGLVPDEVKRVRVTERSGPPQDRFAPISVHVKNNIYDVTLPSRMGPRLRMQWFDTNGHVIRTLHPGF